MSDLYVQMTQLVTYLLTHKLFTSGIRRHQCVTWLQLSDASIICHVTCFQFSIQSAFLPCQKPGSCSGKNVGSTFIVCGVQCGRMIMNSKNQPRTGLAVDSYLLPTSKSQIGSNCIPSCITHRPLPTYQISLKSKKLFVDQRMDGRTDIL